MSVGRNIHLTKKRALVNDKPKTSPRETNTARGAQIRDADAAEWNGLRVPTTCAKHTAKFAKHLEFQQWAHGRQHTQSFYSRVNNSPVRVITDGPVAEISIHRSS